MKKIAIKLVKLLIKKNLFKSFAESCTGVLLSSNITSVSGCSKVFKLGIANFNNKKINEVSSIDVLTNKGIVGDRHFKDFNDPYCQLSLIDSENIDHYNTKYGLKIPYVDFRRNIVTKGINLNELVGKKLLIGNVKVV